MKIILLKNNFKALVYSLSYLFVPSYTIDKFTEYKYKYNLKNNNFKALDFKKLNDEIR